MLALLLAGCMALAAGLAIAFQDTITKFNLSPKVPYQTYTPPPAPDYDEPEAWAMQPGDPEAGLADVFYVHSTTYNGQRHWNANLHASPADNVLRRVAAPNEAGPFMPVGAVYAPRYRQATLFASFTHRYDSRAAHELAFRDVEQAFLHFLKTRPADRPIILVGYGQGGLHVRGLLRYHFAADEELGNRLAAAYVIGQATPLEIFDDALEPIAPCRSLEDVRCVISYIDLEQGFEEEERRYRAGALVWNGEGRLAWQEGGALLCTNPLSWSATDALVDRDHHIGAASATGLRPGETPPAIAKTVSAQCEDGILSVTSPSQSFLRRKHWFGDHWRAQDFNLFFHDLTADAQRRVENLRIILEEEAKILKPVEETVELPVSPVRKVPD
jgi:hypothetical protein